MLIRAVAEQDCEQIAEVHLSAFPEDERDRVSQIACQLLREKSSPETISLVALDNESGNGSGDEQAEKVIGHIAFSPAAIEGTDLSAYILAPLAVHPDYQGRSVGSRLVERGIQLLADNDTDLLFVYGDPGFYGRFGFVQEQAGRFEAPYELQYPFGWQSLVFVQADVEGLSGLVNCVSALDDPSLW